jgi:hypothetical protein
LKYVFEAKRLLKGKFSIGGYVDGEGLQRFVAGVAYAAQYREAGMIGYIQSDNHEYWINELNRRFDSDSDNSLYIIEKLSQVKDVPISLHEWVSQHNRLTGKSITIYHVFLDCSELSG